MQLSIFSLAEPPANPSPLPDFAEAWLTRAETSRSPILQSLIDIGPGGWFGRTSPASCHQTEDGILVPSSGAWANSGMGSPTECLTLSTSEWTGLEGLSLSDEGVSSLSDILETGDLPQRYYLSAKACSGILRRAGKRGRSLPHSLATALALVVQTTIKRERGTQFP
jgi:hypothetical protein